MHLDVDAHHDVPIPPLLLENVHLYLLFDCNVLAFMPLRGETKESGLEDDMFCREVSEGTSCNCYSAMM